MLCFLHIIFPIFSSARWKRITRDGLKLPIWPYRSISSSWQTVAMLRNYSNSAKLPIIRLVCSSASKTWCRCIWPIKIKWRALTAPLKMDMSSMHHRWMEVLIWWELQVPSRWEVWQWVSPASSRCPWWTHSPWAASPVCPCKMANSLLNSRTNSSKWLHPRTKMPTKINSSRHRKITTNSNNNRSRAEVVVIGETTISSSNRTDWLTAINWYDAVASW